MRGTRLHDALRLLPNIILAIYLVAVACVVGFLTNWFRYVPSLEATFVMRTMLLPGILIVVLFFVGRRLLAPLVTALLLLGVAGVSTGLTWVAVREAFGTLRGPALDHIERNGDQTIRLDDRKVLYHLELINPYSSGRSVLVLQDGPTERRVDIPLFKRAIAGYVVADKPADWITLLPTSRPNVLELRTTSYLRAARFEVDLATGIAREVP
jgi:hypothetical protein